MVIRNFIDSPEPDVEANPIVIGDDLALLGSASNPIVIHVDEDCGHYAMHCLALMPRPRS